MEFDLFTSIENNDIDTILKQVSLGPLKSQIHCINNKGLNALMSSIRRGHNDLSKILIKAGISLNHRNNDGDCSLIIACKKRNNVIVIEILKTSAESLNIINNEGNNALMIIASSKTLKKNTADILETMKLYSMTSIINQTNYYGQTALMCASRDGFPETVEFLLRNGADYSVKDKYGNSAFLLALYNKNALQIMKLLAKAGCNVHETNNIGNNILIEYIDYYRKNEAELFKFILGLGINTKLQNINKETPLIKACRVHLNAECFKELIKEYTIDEINTIDNAGNSALFYAIDEIILILLEHGANVNIINKQGSTVIMYSLYINHHSDISHIDILIDKLDRNIINQKDYYGHTALHLAILEGAKTYINIIKKLLKKGIDHNIRDNSKNTAFDYIKNNKVTDAMALIMQKELKESLNLPTDIIGEIMKFYSTSTLL